jgi:hypothetical protein
MTMRVICGICDAGERALSQVDEYTRERVTVKIYACDCGGRGTCLVHPTRYEPVVEGDLEVAR